MLVSVISLDGDRVRHVRPQMNLCCGLITWGRDGVSFVAAGGTDLKERHGLFRVDADSGEATPLMLSPDGERYNAHALSPDGKELYYLHVTPSAFRIVARTLASGVEREFVRRTRGPSSVANVLAGLHLSPDGQQIVTGTTDPASNVRALLVVSVSSGESRELLRASTGTLEVLMWAPDSRSVFVRRRADAGAAPEVLRVPITGGEPVKVEWTLGHDTRDFRVHPDGRQIVFVQNNAAGAAAEVRVMPGVAR